MARAIVKNAKIALAGEVLSKIPLLAFELFVARTLSLSSYAQWSAFQTLLRAIPFAHLGILSDYNKHYPRLLGRKQKRAAASLDYSAARSIMVVSFALWVLFSFSATVLLFMGKTETALILGIISLTIVAAQIYVFLMAKFRNDYQFVVATKGLVLYSFAVLACGFLLVPVFGVTGGFLAYFAGYSLAAVYYIRRYPKPESPRLFSTVKLLRRGSAPFLLTISHYAFQMSDRIAFTAIGDEYLLAGYGFSFLFIQIIFLFVGSLGRVVAPYALRSFSGGSPESAFQYSSIFALLVLTTTGFTVWGILLFGDWFVGLTFADYLYTLDALPIYVAAGGVLAAGQTFFTPLIGLNLERFAILLNLGSALLIFLLLTAINAASPIATLSDYALASLALYTLYFFSMLVYLCMKYPVSRNIKIRFIKMTGSLSLFLFFITLLLQASL